MITLKQFVKALQELPIPEDTPVLVGVPCQWWTPEENSVTGLMVVAQPNNPEVLGLVIRPEHDDSANGGGGKDESYWQPTGIEQTF